MKHRKKIKTIFNSPLIDSYFNYLKGIGEYASLCANVFKICITQPPSPHLVLRQIYEIGVASFPVVAVTGFFTGLVLAAQSFYQLSDKGLAGLTGLFVAKSMVTELGPILTAFMIVGRVGAAICAELGTMHVTEQIDALETMAVNPNRYLVAPRCLAGVIIMPFLTTFSVVMGTLGGYLVSISYFRLAPSSYLDAIRTYVTLFDLISGLIKSLIFAIFIMSISCYKGIKTSGGAAGVGVSTTKSVVTSYIWILCTNFFLTLALNALREHIFKRS